MNARETNYYLEMVAKFGKEMRAFVEGKEIEWYDDTIGQWKQISEPHWCRDARYRVKPEPRTLYIVLDPDGQFYASCDTLSEAAEMCQGANRYTKATTPFTIGIFEEKTS